MRSVRRIIRRSTYACGPHEVEPAFEAAGLDLPPEWQWSRSAHVPFYREANCGIMGGHRTDFIGYYAELAMNLMLDPAHAAAWNRFPDRAGFNMVVEQFLLHACVEFHRSHPSSPFRGLSMRYLFSSYEEALDQRVAARAGFTICWESRRAIRSSPSVWSSAAAKKIWASISIACR